MNLNNNKTQPNVLINLVTKLCERHQWEIHWEAINTYNTRGYKMQTLHIAKYSKPAYNNNEVKQNITP